MNHEAIYALYPSVHSVDANGIAKDFNGNVVMYDIDVINAWVNPVEYKQQRAAEYPSIGDQLDALFHAGVFPEAMAAQIQAIKDKYPKS